MPPVAEIPADPMAEISQSGLWQPGTVTRKIPDKKEARSAPMPFELKDKRSRRVLLLLDWYAQTIHRGIYRYAAQAGWGVDLAMVRSSGLPQSYEGNAINLRHWI